MKQPEGFQDPHNASLVCLLLKSIYGLRQASRVWYDDLSKFLIDIGFTRCSHDQCIFTKEFDDGICLIGLYVDDILPASKSQRILKELKTLFSRKYEIKDLGEIHWYLGMEITRDRANKTMTLSVSQYIQSQLEEFGMADCAPISTPMDASIPLIEAVPGTLDKRTPYREAIGVLLYISQRTRPDIA